MARFIKNSELQDKRIVLALHQAATDFEDGEIAEVRDVLQEIIDAIDEFEEMY